MRLLLFLSAVIAFAVWRARTLDRYDREHGLGPYADVAPNGNPGSG